MSARVHLRRVAVAAPSEAAHAVTHALQSNAPHARDVLLAIVDRGGTAGLCPAPWTLHGVVAALPGAEIQAIVLGPGRGEPDGNVARLHGMGIEPAAREDPIALGNLRIPKAWIGRRLCLVVPCATGATRSIVAPIGAGLAALATSVGATLAPDLARVGESLAATVFCHVAVVVDASWSAIVADNGDPPRLHPSERCVGAWLRSPTTADVATRARVLDAWLHRRLGLPASIPAPALTIDGDRDAPWTSSFAADCTALADRVVPALWRGTDPRRDDRSAKPGALGRVWNSWADPRSS